MTTTTTANNAFKDALKYLSLGISIVPIKTDGSKSPVVPWKQFQTQLPDEATVRNWYESGESGVATITGAISRHLEIIDFDAPELFDPWKTRVVEAGGQKLLDQALIVFTVSAGQKPRECGDLMRANMARKSKRKNPGYFPCQHDGQ